MANRPEQTENIQNQNNKNEAHNSLLKGSAWITAGSVFSRILGAIYIIPWITWLGSHYTSANAIFSKGYNVYSLLLVFSAAGIPGAISKQVAHYNSLNEYALGQKLFRQGLKIMALFGLIGALVLYLGAPLLSVVDFKTFEIDSRTIPVFRSLSFAILVIPVMSITRGFFQGYNDMAPSAISQFFEQLARVIYLLVATYIIMQVQKGNYVNAVTHSTFAAFIGALAGIAVLAWVYFRRKSQFDDLAAQSANNLDISTSEIIKQIIHQAIPFIILDSGITIFQIFDQYSFYPMMKDFVIATQDQLDAYFAVFNFNAQKLVMIVISLATALAMTAIPLLAGAHARKDVQGIREQINDTLELFLFVMFPAAFGMSALARPLYTLFYFQNDLGTWVLQFYSYVAIFLGLFTVLAAVLQGLYMNRMAIKYLVVGIITKIVLQYPMIFLFRVFGPLVATCLGMAVTCALMLRALYRAYQFNIGRLVRRTFAMAVFSVIMLVGVSLVVKVFSLFLNGNSRFATILPLTFGVLVGVAIYGYLALKTQLADRILGTRVARIRQRLKIK
ncbi:polysaccharide biosynthesis C-terminal domain-containing protein [Agrilactobacillus yilanensis]|uniref:Polysaccharide biosynthesis C-terminal domain-containing protein n=1 Tax=Agrilactobacillus yilanensis TaxID=2485997 RepID=A0ABW4J5F8_9LACO|nr:polysaccharide biosynthesis protein [Agrilactobacillus yilanensis]